MITKENINGITTTHVYGSNRIFERKALSVQPEYELIAPKGKLRVGAEISSLKSMTTQMYPYIVSQTMTCGQGLRIRRTSCRKVRCESCCKSFSIGDFTEKSRITETTAEPGDPPYRLTDYYHLQNEYATAPRATVSVGLRYHFHLGDLCRNTG